MGEPPWRATLVMSVPPVQTEEGEVLTLTQDLRVMVNNPEYSDMHFVCSDGGKVYALRLLLAGRSCVLKSLLTNGMRESRLTEIPLPEITTAAMLATVEFLYTGSIVHNQPTVASAFQTVQASRFFMLDKLEKYVTDYIVAGLKAEVVDADGEFLVWCVTQFAEQIYTSDKHIMDKAYVDSGVAGLVQDMVRKLEAMDTHGHLLNSLCVQAFNVYLAATDGLNRWTISFKEYLRLRRILLWACSKVSRQAEEKLRIGLPDEECLRGESKFRTCRESIAKKAPVAKRPLDPSVLQELRTWVEKLNLGWASVELQCIHPLILVEILEPLDVVPYPLFLSALKWQALLAGEMNVLKWRPNNTCTIVESGAVLLCAGHIPDETFVTGCANMIMNHGMCGWEITVETPCERVWIGLGFCRWILGFSGLSARAATPS